MSTQNHIYFITDWQIYMKHKAFYKFFLIVQDLQLFWEGYDTILLLL